jgi:PIN domain nuclease of toxin-antitoxin system
MTTYVADTHALYWYLVDSRTLGRNASVAFDEAAAGRATILIPAILLAELFYLNQKHCRPLDFAHQYGLLSAAAQFQLILFDPTDVLDFDADSAVPEMHDRLIVGLARRRAATLLTRDAEITSAALVPILW